MTRPAQLTAGLGYFSLGLGTAQLVAPGAVNQAIGVRDDTRTRLVQRIVGVQELGAAAGIFAQRRPTEVLWGRTAADVVHLGLLYRALRGRGHDRARVIAAMASVAGTFVADSVAALDLSSEPEAQRAERPAKGTAAITVRVGRELVARRWREFVQGDPASRMAPITVLRAEPGRSVEWQTTETSSLRATGTARFIDAPGDRGTEIHLSFDVETPGGPVGEVVRKVTGDDPRQVVRDDLRRFKQIAETGLIARSEGTPAGHTAETQPKQRPAQPLEHATAS